MVTKIQGMKSQNSADAAHSQNKSQKITMSVLHGTSLEDSLEKTRKTPGFKRRNLRPLIKRNRNSSLLKWTPGLDLVVRGLLSWKSINWNPFKPIKFHMKVPRKLFPTLITTCLSLSYQREWMLHKHIHFSTHFSQSFLFTVSVTLVFFDS